MAVDNVPGTEQQQPLPLDPEAGQWAELMEEMEQAEGGEGGEAETPAPAEPESPEPIKEPEQDAKPEPTPQELKARLDNLNKAVRAERAEKQALTQRLNTYDEFIKQLREGRGQKQEQPKEPEQPQIPSLDEDPVGHFQAQVALLQQEIKQLSQGNTQTAQQLQAQNEEQAFWNQVVQSEEMERSTAPSVTVNGKPVSDYDLACQHLEGTRVAELEMMLPDDSPGAIAAAERAGVRSPAELRATMLNRDRIAVAQHAMALGMSPAKLYYSLAKQRGYQSPQQQLAPQDKTKQQLAAVKRGQKASSTISGGGTGTKNELGNLTDLIDLYGEDPEEFDQMWDKMAASGRLG